MAQISYVSFSLPCDIRPESNIVFYKEFYHNLFLKASKSKSHMLMQFEQKLRQSHTKENVANIKNDLIFPPGEKMVKT